MEELAERLEAAADALTTVERSWSAPACSPGAFGADDETTPGRLGRRLHDRWLAVVEARSREAAAVAARLTTIAADVRQTGRAYAETDDEVGRRIRRGM